MKYLSVCSGIEAATAAWHPLGWEPAAFAEIDPFACAVLRHHYPGVPNRGDFTTIADAGPIDLLVGGTPCQDFSVAGLRAGLAGARGHLTTEFLALAGRARPRWVVWENVPGVLSIDDGRAFGTFLGRLAELGYGFAYRVLDAQHFGVPQRRRRVFVVGHLGDWRRAAAVLFERHSLSGHPPPRKEAGQRVADGTEDGARDRVARALTADMQRYDAETETLISDALYIDAYNQSGAIEGPDGTLDGTDNHLVAHSLRADGFDAGEDGTGRGTPLVPVSFDSTWSSDYGFQEDVSVPMKDGHGTVPAVAYSFADGRGRENLDQAIEDQVAALHCAKGPSEQQIVAYQCQGTNVGEMGTLREGDGGLTSGVPFAVMENVRAELRLSEQTDALTSGGGKPGQGYAAALACHAVRRLTPEECEALQGFPRGYTAIPYRGKPAADGPRYRALGNSMAVPVMRWIGRRIQMVEEVRV